jgi:hypothetical protein
VYSRGKYRTKLCKTPNKKINSSVRVNGNNDSRRVQHTVLGIGRTGMHRARYLIEWKLVYLTIISYTFSEIE